MPDQGQSELTVRRIAGILKTILLPVDILANTLAHYDLIFHKNDLEHTDSPFSGAWHHFSTCIHKTDATI